MSGVEILLVTVIIAVGSALQGSVGFGANLIAAPFFVLIEPDLLPGPALVAAMALNLSVIWRERHSGRLRDVRWPIAGRVLGAPLGAAALVAIPAGRIELLFGALILVAVGLTASRWAVEPTSTNLLAAGATSGFTATTIGVGGPPMAIVHQHTDGPLLRATLARFFAVGLLISFASLAVVGRLGVDELRNGLLLVPGTLIGVAASTPLSRRLDRGHTRLAILCVCTASAVVVLVQALT